MEFLLQYVQSLQAAIRTEDESRIPTSKSQIITSSSPPAPASSMVTSKTEMNFTPLVEPSDTDASAAVQTNIPEIHHEPEIVEVEPEVETNIEFDPGQNEIIQEVEEEEDSSTLKEEAESEDSTLESRNSEVISPSSLSVPQKVQFFEEFSKDTATLYAPQAPVLIVD